MNSETAVYIAANADANVHKLALTKAPDEVDLPFALSQIDGRQRAKKKLPSIAAIDGIIYPPHISLEQCSSEETAVYKAQLAERLGGESFVDLTGGFGIDFIYMSKRYKETAYIERQELLCSTARTNFPLLGMSNAKIVNADAVKYLEEMQPVDTIYLDPGRRNVHGNRVFLISDCTPNIIGLLPLLRAKALHVIIKLSPMLDWRKAIYDLNNNVSEVHIVSVNDECKELLLVIGKDECISPLIYCVNIGAKVETFVYNAESLVLHKQLQNTVTQHCETNIQGSKYLLLPNPSIMKAGCFDLIGERFEVFQLSPFSHIFLSGNKIEGFPGKHFMIKDVSTMNKRELRQKLSGIAQANIATRNFPMTAVELRKRLKIHDGGDTYIFASTSIEGNHLLFICEKLG